MALKFKVYTAMGMRVSRACLKKIADAYLLIAPALTWRGRISQQRKVNSKQF